MSTHFSSCGLIKNKTMFKISNPLIYLIYIPHTIIVILYYLKLYFNMCLNFVVHCKQPSIVQ